MSSRSRVTAEPDCASTQRRKISISQPRSARFDVSPQPTGQRATAQLREHELPLTVDLRRVEHVPAEVVVHYDEAVLGELRTEATEGDEVHHDRAGAFPRQEIQQQTEHVVRPFTE